MSEKIYLSIPNGTETINLNSEIILNNYTRNEVYHNSLKPVDSSCRLSIPFDSTLVDALITHADENIKAQIKNGTNVIFTGYLRKNFEFSKDTKNQPVALEIISPSFLLNKIYAINEKLENKTLYQLLDHILVTSGFISTSQSIDLYTTSDFTYDALRETIDVVVFSEDSNVKDLLKDLCFEFGCVYNFDKNGVFKLYSLFDEPGTISQVFTNDNMKESVSFNKKETEYNNVCAIWNKKEYHSNELIFSDTQNADDSNKCKISIAPNEYLFNETTNYCEYDNDKGNVIWADTAELTVKGISASAITKENLNTRMSVSYKNGTSNAQTITQFDIHGNCWIELAAENRIKAAEGNKTHEIKIKYLNNENSVKDFVQNVLNYYKYSDFTASVKSFDDYALGSFVTVSTEGLGTLSCRIIQKKYQPGKAFEYKLEAVVEYSTNVLISSSVRKSVKDSNIVEVVNQNNQSIANIQEEVSEISVPVTVMLYKRYSTEPSSTGISGNAIYNFRTNKLIWDSNSDNNGWSTAIPSTGTDPIYITAASISGLTSEVISSTMWATPVLFVKNGNDGANSAEVYNIVPSYNLVTRYNDNTLSSEQITFKFYKANQSSRGLHSVYYVISGLKNGIWGSITNGTNSEVTVEVGNYDGLKCDIYTASGSVIPLDSETVLIVSEGSDSITVNLSNANVTVPADYNGVVTSYEGTETIVYVLCGSEGLNYGNATERGFFEVSILNVNVEGPDSSSSIVFSENYSNENDEIYIDADGNQYLGAGYFVLPKITKLTAEAGQRTIAVKGTSYNGQLFELDVVQNITKVRNGEKGDQGAPGVDGIPGNDGKDGKDGADGKTTYFHIKYGAVANPSDSEMTETPSDYIGTYVDYIREDSTSASSYTWSRFKGDPGSDGIPGTDGKDGDTYYLHIAYSNSSDGTIDFSVSDSSNKTYIGVYTDKNKADSTDPTKYSWSKSQGPKGNDGDDGINTATVVIYQRKATQPVKPTANLIYTFTNEAHTSAPSMEWTGGDSKGWLFEKPEVTAEKLPLWETRATALSNTLTDTIKPSEWGTIKKTQFDSGVTEQELNEALLENNEIVLSKLEPVFDYNIDSGVIAVNENNIVPRTQTIKAIISCKRNGADIPFEVTSVIVPDGFTYIVDGCEIQFTALSGSLITNDTFKVTLKTSAYDSLLYADQSGNAYVNEDSEDYAIIKFNEEEISTKVFFIAYTTVKGGKYNNSINNLSNIPSDAIIGDYFTWAGNKTSSVKSITGYFQKSCVYTWDGAFWVEDDNKYHISTAYSDVFAIEDADLEEHNPVANEYLDHLSANSIFARKVVSKLVESELIISKDVITTTFETIAKTEKEQAETIAKANANIKVISDDYVKSGDLNDYETINALTETLKSYVTGNSLTATLMSYYTKSDIDNKGYLLDETIANEILEALKDSSGKTVIEPGFVMTDLIDADVVLARYMAGENADFTGNITAKTLAIQDVVNVGENFKLDKNGNVEAVNGKFKGSIKTFKGLVFGYSNSWIDNMSYNDLFDLIKNTLIANDWTTGGNDIWYNASGSLIFKIQDKKVTSLIYYFCIQFSSINITKSEGYITDITIDGSLDVLNSYSTSEERFPNVRFNLYKQPTTTWSGSKLAVVERGYSGNISTTYYSLSNYNITISGYYRA